MSIPMEDNTNPTVATGASTQITPHVSLRQHTVLLVHGIRTTAEWQHTIRAVLETSDPTIRVIPTSFGFFDVFRFLFPFWTFRRAPLRRVTTLVRTEITNPRTKRLSLIGHSFGTWLIAKMLETENDLVFHRIILCGSVIAPSFPWEKYAHRVGPEARGDSIINDCGSRDIWPVLAQSVTWGYGASGRFGFGHPDVRDRFHDLAHSGFFAEEFVRDFWLPFLKSGAVSPGSRTPKPSPWALSVIAGPIKIRWIMLAMCLTLAASTFRTLSSSPDSIASESRETVQHTPHSTAEPTGTTAASKEFTNSIGMQFVWIPPGTFMMGSERPDESPRHQVTISRGFYLGKSEVTQLQWQAVMGPRTHPRDPIYFYGCESCPVEWETWDQAIAFIAKLNDRQDGYVYELPSESKWEYACLGGSNGDHLVDLDSEAWYANNSGSEKLDATKIYQTGDKNYYDTLDANLVMTHPVGGKKPNAFGLFDMRGNVWEWCADEGHENYDGAPSDGRAWSKGGQGTRIRRGGSFLSPSDMLRCAARVIDPSGRKENDIGFRLVAARAVVSDSPQKR